MRPPPPASACGERLALYGWHTHASASPCQGEWGARCAFVFNGTLKRPPCPGCPASVCRKLFVPCGRIVPVVSPASGRLRALRAFRLRATRSRVLLAPARCAVCALRHAAGTLTRLPERARHWLIALHYSQSHAPTASKCGALRAMPLCWRHAHAISLPLAPPRQVRSALQCTFALCWRTAAVLT